MSYDINIVDPTTGETIETADPHHIAGGTYQVGGTTRLWLNIAKNPHVDVIGHCGEELFKFDYEEAIRAFKAYGKIVEINNASFRTRPTARDNCMRIAELCAKHGVPLVVGSDAHFAGAVGDFRLAEEYLLAAGIPEESIISTDCDRFAAHLRRITGRNFS